MRVLVVEDNALLRHHLKVQLQELGHQVDAAEDAREADYYLGEHLPDIAIVDLGLPDEDGLSLIRRWRSHDVSLPVLVLTAREGWQDKVEVLSAGADDYVTKPFSLEEVVARIRAILRRTREQVEDDPIIRVADLEINEDSHDVTRAGQPVDLSPTEYKLLRYLMDNEGRVLSKAQILDHVWQYDWGGDAAIVESYISYLRKKVDGIEVDDGEGGKRKVTPLIETKRGIGYMIREPKN